MNEFPHCQVVKHPLIEIALARLRNRDTELEEFRRSLHQLAILVGAEAARSLELRKLDITTPLASCGGYDLARPIVIVPILRAGLGMADPLAAFLPGASVGHVGLYRDERTFEPHCYYFKAPPLEEAEIFVVDPMLATGHSAADAVQQLKNAGAKRLQFVGVIGAKLGLEYFSSRHPDVPIFLAAIDADLDERAYIIPGLGDAGDRYFGT